MERRTQTIRQALHDRLLSKPWSHPSKEKSTQRQSVSPPLQPDLSIYVVFKSSVNTFLANPDCPIIDPPKLETALYFLAIFTHLEDEFNRIDLINTGLFDLDHPETAQQLDLSGVLRTIKSKSQLAKNVLRWVDDNRYGLEQEEPLAHTG
ncbi:MAG: hypothetical protein AAF572_23510 [Cyanobacteria bacterium P01_B01_bin.77]